MRIAESTIREIQDRIDPVALVGEYVRLERRGGRFWGLCPFHNEKTPSFTVDPDKKFYYCFGCHQGGGIINFVQEMDKLSYFEALTTLAKKYGVQIVWENQGNFVEDKEEGQKDEIAELCGRVAGSFHHILLEKPEGNAALRYITGRSISKPLIEQFCLGYAPNDRYWLHRFLVQKGYSEAFLAKTGLFSRQHPESALFQDRLIFPIHDRQGRTVAFGGRLLSGEGPKYLNSPETGLYHKRETLYAIDLALGEIRKTKEVYLAEGYMDVLALHEAGVRNAVAPLGTAFTEEQARLLRRWASRVKLIFDSDDAGQNATVKAILICRKNNLSCDVVDLHDGLAEFIKENPSSGSSADAGIKDPADILKKFGSEALQKSLKCSILDFDYLLKKSSSLYNLSDSGEKAGAVAFMFPYLETFDSEVAREAAIDKVAEYLRVERDAVKRDFMQTRGVAVSVAEQKAPAPVRMNDELFLLMLFVKHNLYPDLRSALSIEEIEDPWAKKLFIALEECYRQDTLNMEALLGRIEDETLRRFVMEQSSSGAFSMNPEQLVQDGLRRIKQKRLERRLKEIVVELRNLRVRDDHPAVKTLLSEKLYVDSELLRIKDANE